MSIIQPSEYALSTADADTQGDSATEAYVHWLREILDSGAWSSDPTQPCLLYKIYQDVPRVALNGRFPLRLGSSSHALRGGCAAASAQADPVERLGWLLYYAHGLTRIIRAAPGSLPNMPEVDMQPTLPRHLSGPEDHPSPFLGRPVPSGGNLHPVEIYLALGSQWSIPAGIYHYDSAHHALDLLRTGDFLNSLVGDLPEDQKLQNCTALLLPAVCFQKNYQKYAEMSYRLQCLDSGVVIEQLRFLAGYFGLHPAYDWYEKSKQQQNSGLHLRFLDQPLHQLVGLDIMEESIYAVIPLHYSAQSDETPVHSRVTRPSDTLPLSAVTTTHIQPFTPLARDPLFDKIHSASLERTRSLKPVESAVPEEHIPDDDEIALPLAQIDQEDELSQVLLRRRSGFCSIDTTPLESTDMAALLTPLQGLSEGEIWRACACQIYCVISRINGIPQGVYRYSPARHALSFVHNTEVFPILMRISTAPNVQPELVAANLFLCADYRRAFASYGERGFRLMGIELGRALQRLTLAASARQLASHTHLSYLMKGTARRLLQLSPASQIPMVSMMVGHERRSQGGLLEATWY